MAEAIRAVEPVCRSCGSSELQTFLSLGSLPLADGLLDAEALSRPEPRHPLEVAVCGDCALVQLTTEVPPEVLFGGDYPYYSSYSDALLEHSRRNVEALVGARGLGPESLVVELASNDGYLLQHYRRQGIPVLGIDPAEGPAREAIRRGIPTLREFFGRALAGQLAAEGRLADVVHANNVLAHVPDLNGFVEGIATLLKPDGVAVVEVPYVLDLIDQVEFDTIYHEHHCYFSVTALVRLLRRNGLVLNDVEHLAIHGGSLRLFASRRGELGAKVRALLERESRLRADRLDYYSGFGERVARLRDELRALLARLRVGGARIAAYGAAAKGAVLTNYVGIGRETLEFVVDRNDHKHGMFMPGVHVPILPTRALRERRPDYVLLLAWNFREEILAQQADYLRAGGRFIVPVPRPEIVGGVESP